MARPKTLQFIGPRDANGHPLEWFSGSPGEHEPIPASDLNEADTAALSEAQWTLIDSPAGKRLYAAGKPASSTGSQPNATAAQTVSD